MDLERLLQIVSLSPLPGTRMTEERNEEPSPSAGGTGGGTRSLPSPRPASPGPSSSLVAAPSMDASHPSESSPSLIGWFES